MSLKKPDQCVVCASPYMAALGQYKNEFGRATDLFFCMECQSFSSPFSTPDPVSSSLKWHQSVEERNLNASGELLDFLTASGTKISRILDIGCGTGTLLRKAKERGIDGVGFDLDADSIRYGRETFGLDLRAEKWTPDLDVGHIDLITCIMVLEHIHYPRELIGALAKAAKTHKCPIFVSVPFFEKDWWPHLLRDNQTPGFHPLKQPNIHVTHYTRDGMTKAFNQHGASGASEGRHRMWPGLVIAP